MKKSVEKEKKIQKPFTTEDENFSSSLTVRSEKEELLKLDDLWEHIKEVNIRPLIERKNEELERKKEKLVYKDGHEKAGDKIDGALKYVLKGFLGGDEDARSPLEKEIDINKAEEIRELESKLKELESLEKVGWSGLESDGKKFKHIRSTLECILKIDEGNIKALQELENLEVLAKKEKDEKAKLKKDIEKLKGELKTEQSRCAELEKELTLIREELRKEKEEFNKRIDKEREDHKKETEKLLNIVEKSAGREVKNTIINEVSASVSNQVNVTIPIQYDKGLEKKEIDELRQDYQKLEATDEPSSDPQKLKKVILFLSAKQIFATTRQGTINGLVEIYKSSNKSGQRYDKIIKASSYISEFRDIANIAPGGGIVIDVLGKGIPVITELLKGRSLDNYTKKFGDYLREDEKVLNLLKETIKTVSSLQDDQSSKVGSVLSDLFNYDQGLLNKDSVFKISKESGINLRESENLDAESMEKIIESLDNRFEEFTGEIRKESEQYAEKVGKIFTGESDNRLQIDLTLLLVELSVKVKENSLRELKEDAKKKLGIRNQERKEKVDLIFEKLPSTPEEFTNELKGIKENYLKRVKKEEINSIYRVKDDLDKLKSEPENLKNQQTQVEHITYR